MAEQPATEDAGLQAPFPLPRVSIQFCTQCKWNLRAAYFAQELLSTFSTSLGEVALQPSTGGTFVVTITHRPEGTTAPATVSQVLWDRNTDGGFPETKELKRRVRDVIQPGRNLGHVDRDYHRKEKVTAVEPEVQTQEPEPASLPNAPPLGIGEDGPAVGKGPKECEDCV